MNINTNFKDILTDTIQICDITGKYHAVQRNALIKLAQECIVELFVRGEAMINSQITAHYLQVLLGNYEYEVFYALWLDNQHHVLCGQELFRGTVDGSSVYPREVVKAGLACNAVAVIVAHYVSRNIMCLLCPVSLCGVYLPTHSLRDD